MKKRQLLALGLLCGVMLPLSTQAIENGIYEVEGGHHTLLLHDNTWGDINITISSGDVPGWYCRGNNYKWDVKCTNVTDKNAWGGSDDTYENGFLPFPDNYEERQGPCESGWHIPSIGERNSLVIGLCSIDDSCNARYSDEEKSGITGNLVKANGWTEYNRLIDIINHKTFLDNFLDLLNLKTDFYYWASSPYWLSYIDPDNDYSWRSVLGTGGSEYTISIRCFKNSIIEPQFFTVNFLNEGESIRSGNILSGDKISEEVINDYLTGLTKTGYTFSGWAISDSEEKFDVENDTVTTLMTLNAVWEIINYDIEYKLDGGTNNENNVTGFTVETETITLSDPTKEGHNFSGRFLDTGFTNQITEITKGSTGDITLYAKWTKTETKPSGGSSGGGGRSSKTSDIQDSSTSSQNDNKSSSGTDVKDLRGDIKDSSDKSSEGQSQQQFTQEFQEAYEFAHEKGITTMPTIQEAQMDGKLTRIAMAKILSQYAMNVLGQKPANIVTPKFNDVTDKQNSDYDDGVTLSYQLGIMGQNMPNNKFRPNDEVTRAEFATALSRMLYNTSDGEYKSTPKYYIHHMEKLVKEGIITKDDPNMKELRGYVMIMLMRSAK